MLKVKICSEGDNQLRRKLSETEFGLAAVYRIIKKSGAERVSDEAAEELRRVVEDIASQVAKQATELSVHAGRHTVKASDVRLAAKNVLRTP
ncbi:MAG: NFYB/HAP3 family transcription factor subunit [Nitrososphaerota archaeon]|nr:NFYB/HAP3 family transcription factor subunit [Nitrososphaerota archaeon]